jgi:hypothetical protein
MDEQVINLEAHPPVFQRNDWIVEWKKYTNLRSWVQDINIYGQQVGMPSVLRPLFRPENQGNLPHIQVL